MGDGVIIAGLISAGAVVVAAIIRWNWNGKAEKGCPTAVITKDFCDERSGNISKQIDALGTRIETKLDSSAINIAARVAKEISGEE